MTTITAASRRKQKVEYAVAGGDSPRALLFLAAACLWPLVIFVVFALSSSAPESTKEVSASVGRNLRFNFRNVVDRVDIMGYGPTHPRVAAVIVGDNEENLVSSVESLFRFTDMNRIFVVTVVVDGHSENKELLKKLKRIDDGAIPHWHGLRPDIHETPKGGVGGEADDDPHGSKVHVIFNPQKLGVTESRADGVEFVRILQKHHEEAGLKSQEEDLILLLMQGGAQLTARSWLEPVTEALIVPPPIISKEEDSSLVAMKVANAVAFNLEGPGKRTGFDTTFTPVISDASATDINLSSGTSYPTPALNGAAVAMRLDTYLNLPLQDLSLSDVWEANLDLSLNLWLCADGIDMIKGVDVTSLERQHEAPLTPELAARFAAAWMDEVTAKKFYNAYSKLNDNMTFLEWQTFVSEARNSPTFTKDLATRCRSFAWYAEEINTDMSEFLTESAVVEEDTPEKSDDKEDKKAETAQKNDNDSTDDTAIPERHDEEQGRKPSKPLTEENLKIIQEATPVDISYVDVSGGHKEHPHLGAKDENGTFGYIHDETALRKNPPAFGFEGEPLRNACLRRDNNYRMLHERVFVNMEKHEEAEKTVKKRVKIFCLVYTTEAGHPRIPKIRETWG